MATSRGTRADLLALTTDALAALTNRGLVKRAVKTVDEGTGPVVSTDGDDVRGEYPDGIVTVLPPGGLETASCSCGAGGTCRHVLALIIAYQGAVDGAAAQLDGPTGGCVEAAAEDWSPGEFTDEELETLIGTRGMRMARKLFAAGYSARVQRPGEQDPTPRVELPTCTVRFLVPHDLGYVRSDAAAGSNPEAVALAVWAFRTADDLDRTSPDPGHLQVGGPDGGDAMTDDGFGQALDLAEDVLLTGAVHLGSGFAPRLPLTLRALDAAGYRWPLSAVEELAELLDSYRNRSTRYRPEYLAEVLAELYARHRAAAFPRGSARARILGTEEAAETQLRRVRMTGLGCRVDRSGDERRVQIYLADTLAGTALTIAQTWPDDGSDLARRRLAGSTVAALAAGNIVTETAVRGADRRLRFGVNRIARTTVSPSAGVWDTIPSSLLVRDLDALTTELDGLPPRLIRPRVAAEDLRVIELGDVREIGYSPGSQRLEATVTASGGGRARLVAEHKAFAPAALDALAESLSGSRGAPRYVSGTVRRSRGGIVIAPIAVVADETVIIPDLAPGDGSTALTRAGGNRPDPLVATIDAAAGLLAEMAHHGIRNLSATFGTRLDAAGGMLQSAGLKLAAYDMCALRRTLGPDPGREAATAWADAAIRLLTLADTA